MWEEITYPFLNFNGSNRWNLGMDKWFHPTVYNGCNYLSMLGLKLNHVSKSGHWQHMQVIDLEHWTYSTGEFPRVNLAAPISGSCISRSGMRNWHRWVASRIDENRKVLTTWNGRWNYVSMCSWTIYQLHSVWWKISIKTKWAHEHKKS